MSVSSQRPSCFTALCADTALVDPTSAVIAVGVLRVCWTQPNLQLGRKIQLKHHCVSTPLQQHVVEVWWSTAQQATAGPTAA